MGSNYTSARLKTQGKVSWAYGRIEARIKIPRGQGIWPAFWMLGTNISSVGWPNCGEIDIMENIGKEPAVVHGTVHGPGYSGGGGIGAAYSLPAGGAFADDFHLYAVEWTTNQIKWLVDGQQYFSIKDRAHNWAQCRGIVVFRASSRSEVPSLVFSSRVFGGAIGSITTYRCFRHRSRRACFTAAAASSHNGEVSATRNRDHVLCWKAIGRNPILILHPNLQSSINDENSRSARNLSASAREKPTWKTRRSSVSRTTCAARVGSPPVRCSSPSSR